MGIVYCKICKIQLGTTSNKDIESLCPKHAIDFNIQQKEISDKVKEAEIMQKEFLTLTKDDILILKQMIAEFKAPK